jgi:signal transduction histidine kinase
MPEGGQLTIKAEPTTAGKVRIVLSDTGRGMSPDQVERLFEPFATSTTGGTGLGLSIVYQIIRDHNGTINVRSAEGEGTTITVELPRDHKAPAPEHADVEETPSPIESYLNVKETQGENIT